MMHCWFKKIPEKSRFYYVKWLRYYLDVCFKSARGGQVRHKARRTGVVFPAAWGGVGHYGFNQSNKESRSYFIKKLKEKSQTEQQQKKRLHVISTYFDIEFADKDKQISLENKKRILSSKKGGLKSTKLANCHLLRLQARRAGQK